MYIYACKRYVIHLGYIFSSNTLLSQLRPFTYHLLGYTFPSLTMYLFNIGTYTTRFITTDWRILIHHVCFQWFIAKPFF